MTRRAYLLLDVANGNYRWIIQTLKSKPGVTMVDILEGPPDILVMVEASNREKLAEFTVSAMASVENLTENIQLLPRKDEPEVNAHKSREKLARKRTI